MQIAFAAQAAVVASRQSLTHGLISALPVTPAPPPPEARPADTGARRPLTADRTDRRGLEESRATSHREARAEGDDELADASATESRRDVAREQTNTPDQTPADGATRTTERATGTGAEENTRPQRNDRDNDARATAFRDALRDAGQRQQPTRTKSDAQAEAEQLKLKVQAEAGNLKPADKNTAETTKQAQSPPTADASAKPATKTPNASQDQAKTANSGQSAESVKPAATEKPVAKPSSTPALAAATNATNQAATTNASSDGAPKLPANPLLSTEGGPQAAAAQRHTSVKQQATAAEVRPAVMAVDAVVERLVAAQALRPITLPSGRGDAGTTTTPSARTNVTAVRAGAAAAPTTATTESPATAVSRAAATEAITGKAQRGSAAPDVGSKDRANTERILRYIRLQQGKAQSTTVMRLDPPELGKIRIQLDWRDQAVRVRIDTQNHVAQRLLTEDAGALRRGLEASGIHLERMDVRPPQQSQQPTVTDDGQAGRHPGPTADGHTGHADPDAEQTGTRTGRAPDDADVQDERGEPDRSVVAEAAEQVGPVLDSLVNVIA